MRTLPRTFCQLASATPLLALLIGCHHAEPAIPQHDLDRPPSAAPPADAAPVAPAAPKSVVLADHRVVPHDLAITPTALFWIEGTDAAADVVTLRLDTPGAKPTSIVHVASALYALAVGEHDLAYLTPSSLMLVDLDGTHPHIVDRQDFGHRRLALDKDAIYLVGDGGVVERYDRISAVLYPPTKQRLLENEEYSEPDQVALTDLSVVLSNEVDDVPRRIVRVPKAGGEPVRVDNAAGVAAWTTTYDTIFYVDEKQAAWKIAATAADAEHDRISIPAMPKVRYAVQDDAIIDLGPPK